MHTPREYPLNLPTEIYATPHGFEEVNLSVMIMGTMKTMYSNARRKTPIVATSSLEELTTYVNIITNPGTRWRVENNSIINTGNVVPHLMYIVISAFYSFVHMVEPDNLCKGRLGGNRSDHTVIINDEPQKLTPQKLLMHLQAQLLHYIGHYPLYIINMSPDVEYSFIKTILRAAIVLNADDTVVLCTAFALSRIKTNLDYDFTHKTLEILSDWQADTELLQPDKIMSKKYDEFSQGYILAKMTDIGVIDRKNISYVRAILNGANPNSIARRRIEAIQKLHLLIYNMLGADTATLVRDFIEHKRHEIADNTNPDVLYESLRTDPPLTRFLETASIDYRYECTLFKRNVIDMHLVNNPEDLYASRIEAHLKNEFMRNAPQMTVEQIEQINQFMELNTTISRGFHA